MYCGRLRPLGGHALACIPPGLADSLGGRGIPFAIGNADCGQGIGYRVPACRVLMEHGRKRVVPFH
jgi:hypothetical protein